MKLAIYHGFESIHYEMLGYFIEYILHTKVDIDIYSHILLDWKEYYEDLFNIKLHWNNPNLFNPELYDLIFLLTDDDYSFKNEWLEKYGTSKVISIDHCGTIRRGNMLDRISTRSFARRPTCKWALPCYYGISKSDKKLLLDNDKIKVTCIGTQNMPPSIEFLRKLFSNFDEIEFHIIGRYIPYKYDSDNIKVYNMCPTKLMHDIIKKSHYIFCIENPNNYYPIADSMSGSIPLSFGYGCQLILPSNWQKYYNFKSTVQYENTLINSITLPFNTDLDLIYQEQYELISHRNRMIDSCIKIKFPMFNYIYYNTNTIVDIIKDLNLCKPFIFAENNTNIGITLKSYFRELHNDLIENLSNKINESTLFYLDISDNLINNISMLGTRKYIDIIMINNCDYNDDIIKSYSRQCHHYIYDNKFIIYPQK
jgi:hypothetical protein